MRFQNDESTGFEPELYAGINADQVGLLMSPLHSSRVAHRSQGGRQLSYLEAHDVRATLIRVFGFGGFCIETEDCRVMDISRVGEDNTGNYRVTAMAKTRLTIPTLEATYTDVAAATQTGPVLGDVMDFAIKTAVSDSMKRCAVNLGTQFGLSLYVDGATADQVRVLFEPTQAALYKAWLAEREEAQRAEQERVAEQLARATGKQPETQDVPEGAEQ